MELLWQRDTRCVKDRGVDVDRADDGIAGGAGFDGTGPADHQGHALAALGELDAAAEAYQQAKALRQELGHPSLAIDDAAGLARVALAAGDLTGAQQHVSEILTWICSTSSRSARISC